MDTTSTVIGVLFTLQTCIGAPCNLVLLMAYMQQNLHKQKVRPVDTILCHILFVNSVVLLTRGIPYVLSFIGLREFMTDIACKTTVYIYRIVRSVSICATSLLSSVQSITLTPGTTPWMWYLKMNSSKAIIPLLASFWLLNMLRNIEVPFLVGALGNGTIPPFAWNLGLCYSRTQLSFPIPFSLLNTLHDVFFIAVMFSSSTYIVFVLLRHRRKVKSIRSSQQTPNKELDKKAVENVIKLVMLFASFYGIDMSVLAFFMSLSKAPKIISEVRILIGSCYALFSPFLIMSVNKNMYDKLLCIHHKKRMQIGDLPAEGSSFSFIPE